MDKKEKFREIKEKTNAFLNAISHIESTEIKQIDVDSLRFKLTEIYDGILSLIPDMNPVTNVQSEMESEKTETFLPQNEITEKPDEKKLTVEPEPEDKQKPPKYLSFNFEGEKQDEKEGERTKEQVFSEIEFVTEKEPAEAVNKTIGESFQSPKTLNDLVKEVKNEQNLNAGQNLLKIENLLQVISVNDKIEFVRELFKNDAEKYAETIKKINDQKDLDSAIFVLSNLDFDNEKPAAKKLINLVYRRFSNE